MGHALRMPQLPRGPRLDFVVELHNHYRAAKRPTLRMISEMIRADDTLKGTASRETIRRMLLGEVVPAQWETVNAVFLTLCKIAGRDPNGGDEYDNDPRSYVEVLEWRWNEALDAMPSSTNSDEAPF